MTGNFPFHHNLKMGAGRGKKVGLNQPRKNLHQSLSLYVDVIC